MGWECRGICYLIPYYFIVFDWGGGGGAVSYFPECQLAEPYYFSPSYLVVPTFGGLLTLWSLSRNDSGVGF